MCAPASKFVVIASMIRKLANPRQREGTVHGTQQNWVLWEALTPRTGMPVFPSRSPVKVNLYLAVNVG